MFRAWKWRSLSSSNFTVWKARLTVTLINRSSLELNILEIDSCLQWFVAQYITGWRLVVKWIFHWRLTDNQKSVVKWIFHEREARVIYSLTTDRQPVIYWATNHLLARLYFDSNTQEPTKRQVFSSGVASFPPLHDKNFDCNRGVYMFFVRFWCEKRTLQRPTSWKWKLMPPKNK